MARPSDQGVVPRRKGGDCDRGIEHNNQGKAEAEIENEMAELIKSGTWLVQLLCFGILFIYIWVGLMALEATLKDIWNKFFKKGERE